MLPSTTGDGNIMFSGGPSLVRPLTRISRDTIRLYSVLNGGISIKRFTNIHHVSKNC